MNAPQPRPQSEYEFLCECGEKIHCHDPKTVCPECGRQLEVRGWAKLEVKAK